MPVEDPERPAAQSPEHAEVCKPVVEPYLPAGHAFCVALVEPAGQ